MKYYAVADGGEHREFLSNGLGTAFDLFMDELNYEPVAHTLQDEDENVYLYWNGGMGTPEFEFIDPMAPAKSEWMLEQERLEDHYWNYERRHEGEPEL
jgi:hypothetical protein